MAEPLAPPAPRAKPGKPPKKRQAHLPEMAPVKNAKIHPLAEKYADAREEFVAAQKAKNVAHANLVEEMIEQGVKVYDYGDIHVELGDKFSAKVRIQSHQPEDEDGPKKRKKKGAPPPDHDD
jgi:hypothetical protein